MPWATLGHLGLSGSGNYPEPRADQGDPRPGPPWATWASPVPATIPSPVLLGGIRAPGPVPSEGNRRLPTAQVLPCL
jgi:hypothetical protein